MEFTHIHSSSRFSRPVSSLETASDAFYRQASVVTWTEVGAPQRTPALAEAGWGYFNALTNADGQDECAVSWRLDTWVRQWGRPLFLTGRWQTFTGGTRWKVYAATVLLKHKTTGHKLLVSVAHMPNKIGGATGFSPQGQGFPQRKESYITATKNWNAHVVDIERKDRPDLVIVSADWNINFRKAWARDYVNGHFKQSGVVQNWKDFGGKGTFGRSVIDATLYSGMTSDGSVVIADPGDSSDHNPFRNRFTVTKKPGTPVVPGKGSSGTGTTPTDAGGGTANGSGNGVEWWDFEDYGDDTIYHVDES